MIDNKKPLITHLITGLRCGGAERALFTLVTQGLGEWYRSNVISLTGPAYYGPLFDQAGIKVTSLNGRRVLPTIKTLRKQFVEEPPQIVQGWMYHGNLAALGSTYLTRNNIKLAWNVRVSLDDPKLLSFGTRLTNFSCARLSKFPATIIHNSFNGRITHESLGYSRNQAVVIPNGFDLSRWQYSEARRVRARVLMQVDERACVIGFVGRGVPQKDLPNLISAFLELLRVRQDIILVCIGRDLERWLPAQLAEKHVRFLGERSDVEELLPGLDFFCLSSFAEGFPNVVGEAMASGVPCIVTDVGDARRVVGDTGWVVPARDSKALANKLEEVIALPIAERVRLGKLARKRIEEKYSNRAVVMRYVELYQQLLNN